MTAPDLDADDLHWLLPTERTVAGCCPHCEHTSQLVVMRPDATAPVGMAKETLLLCSSCKRLAIPCGVTKRAIGLALFVPFSLVLAAALGTAVYLLGGMAIARAFDGGFAVVALGLAAGAIFGGRKAVRSLRRLLTPGSLLPLGQSPKGHLFQGDL